MARTDAWPQMLFVWVALSGTAWAQEQRQEQRQEQGQEQPREQRPADGPLEQIAPSTVPATPPEAPASERPPAPAAVTAAKEKRFGDWSTLRIELSEGRLCFAVTRARAATAAARSVAIPDGRTSHVHVASWPQAGVRAEVSVRAGTPMRPAAPAHVAIGSQQFTLFTQQERAFVGNPVDELKLLEAMKKGSQMTFTAQTEAGSAVNDSFSLSGFATALAHVTQGCP